jgi:hypothetical protein
MWARPRLADTYTYAAANIMPRTDMWDHLSAQDWSAFARSGLAELQVAASERSDDYEQKVVLMNFTATPEQQWIFIQAAVELAQSDDELGAIAAGPLEHLLGHHGEQYIGPAENLAAASPVFARTLTGMNQYLMSESTWARVRKLQQAVVTPLWAAEDS